MEDCKIFGSDVEGEILHSVLACFGKVSPMVEFFVRSCQDSERSQVCCFLCEDIS